VLLFYFRHKLQKFRLCISKKIIVTQMFRILYEITFLPLPT